MFFYIVAGIIVIVLTILTFTTKDIRWYTTSLLLLSCSVGLLLYHFSLSFGGTIFEETVRGEDIPSWAIYFWPVILSIISFCIGWATRPK